MGIVKEPKKKIRQDKIILTVDYVTISSYHRFYKISMAKLTTLTEVEFSVSFTCDGLADALKGTGRLF